MLRYGAICNVVAIMSNQLLGLRCRHHGHCRGGEGGGVQCGRRQTRGRRGNEAQPYNPIAAICKLR